MRRKKFNELIYTIKMQRELEYRYLQIKRKKKYLNPINKELYNKTHGVDQ